MGKTNPLPSDFKQPLPFRRLQVYPRLQFHISFSDLAASLGSFFYFSNREQSIREIQSFWKGNKNLLVTLSVRTSLDLLLQALNLPPGSEVLMSAANIRDMVEIVQRHKLVPIPVDISLDTLAPSLELLDSRISEKSRILIIAHLFGSIVNLEPYAQICQKHNILLVEDCAQAFAGSHYYGYDKVDISLFSFGSIKSCTALGGAVTLIRDSKLAESMRTLEQQYQNKSEFWFFKRVLKYLGLKFFSIPWIYGCLLAILKFLKLDIDSAINSLARGFSQGDILEKIRYRPSSRMLSLLSRRLKNSHLSKFKQRELQAREFLSMLAPDISCPGKSAEYHSFWVFPILVSNSNSLMEKLREYGFDATRGSTSLTFIPDSLDREEFSGTHSTNAEYLIKHILYLPVSRSLPKPELVRLSEVVNQFSELKINAEDFIAELTDNEIF
jgi:dTDP-4-amino-4,6-dideoxygalactose transaminase